jgi:hypothetical protein
VIAAVILPTAQTQQRCGQAGGGSGCADVTD